LLALYSENKKQRSFFMNTYSETTPVKPAGRKGAIARLAVLTIVSLIGILSSVCTIPDFASRRGLWAALMEAIGGCGILLMLAAWFWGMLKWIAVVGPRSFGWARSFWQAWQPLTFFGVYIKFCIWLIIGMVPVMAFGFSYLPLFKLTWFFAENGIGLIAALLLLALGAGLVALLGFWDLCRLKGLSPTAILRQKLADRKGKAAA
jgi:hypothetical protein